jgi:PKD repeat protein
VQRVAAGVISPPFRVRAITCIWPENPQVLPGPTVETDDTHGADFAVEANEPVRFTGKVSAGTGAIYYTWDFGDGSAPKTGQVAQHTFARNGLYTVRMAVRGEPCPQTRERVKTVTVQVGSGVPDLMLPIIQVPPTLAASEPISARVAAAAPSSDLPAVRATGEDDADADSAAEAVTPPQVTGLKSREQADTETVWLRWDASPTPVDGYRIYRGAREATALAPWIDLPPDVTAHPIESPGCDQAYYLTSYVMTAAGEVESLPSDGTYYTPSCAVDAE